MDECTSRNLLAGTSANRKRKRDRTRLRRGTARAVLALALLAAGQVLAQEVPANPSATPQSPPKVAWTFSITVDGYIPPDEDAYVNPWLTADHGWLHLEGRYNYEDLRTGSVWVGYNFSAGKKLVLNVTPMIGGVFGRTTGVGPGCELSFSYWKLKLLIPNEYVFDTTGSNRSFYYSTPELTYSPTGWLHVGLAAQHTKALETKFDVQRGFVVGFSHKHAQFTTYVYNLGFGDPTYDLEVGWSF